MNFLSRTLHGLGVRRDHVARAPFRPLTRALSQRNLIPLELLMGAQFETTSRFAFPGASFRYHVTSEDGLGCRLFWQHWTQWERYVLPKFAEFAKNARRVLDVGAHTGVYSLFACALNPHAEVICFEPLPFGQTCTARNLRLNGFDTRCKLLPVAVSDREGTAQFHIAIDRTMSSLVETGGDLEVSVVTIDSVVPKDGHTDLVKMDVEGYEDKALAGMTGVMEDSQPTILFECNPGGPAEAIEGLLRSHDYRLFRLMDGKVAEISQLTPDLYPHGHHNFLAVHRKRSYG